MLRINKRLQLKYKHRQIIKEEHDYIYVWDLVVEW